MATLSSSCPLLVRTLYSFSGSNNDELCFVKNQIITVSQQPDGGWWEGTLDGVTGWFPANYVVVVDKDKDVAPINEMVPKVDVADEVERCRRQREFHSQLVSEMIEKEQEFVGDLHSATQELIKPLFTANILSEAEQGQLVGNLSSLVSEHDSLLQSLQSQGQLSPRDQRIGGVLLRHGALLRDEHVMYWKNHPKAVAVIEHRRQAIDKFVESINRTKKGSNKEGNTGLLPLATLLSRPLRHLERYASFAHELQQLMEDDHPDRGDTQRSLRFFKALAANCNLLRRQQELALEILTTRIDDWVGNPIESLGEILHVGIVFLKGESRPERYLVLFTNTIVLLALTKRMSAFIFKARYDLQGMSVTATGDKGHAFQISGPNVERLTFTCVHRQDCLHWLDSLRRQIGFTNSLQLRDTHDGQESNRSQWSPVPLSPTKGSPWKMSCLRPAPPTRHHVAPKKEDVEARYNEDMQILRVVEAYCTDNRKTQVLLNRASSLPHASKDVGTKTSIDADNSLLRQQLTDVREETRELVRRLEEESAARRRLEHALMTQMGIKLNEN